MRICRMEIPMNFTMEYFEEQILNLIQSLNNSNFIAFVLRFTEIRKDFICQNEKCTIYCVSFVIKFRIIFFWKRALRRSCIKISMFQKQLLSTLKTNNKMLQITGSIFADENGYDNCLVLNDEKNVVEACKVTCL